MFVARQYGQPQAGEQRLPSPSVLQLLGAEYLVLPEASAPKFAERVELSLANDAGWPENTAVWRMNRTLPRAWIVHEVETIPPLPFPLRIEAVDARTREVLYPGGKPRDFTRQAVVETTDPLPSFDAGAPTSAAPESCRITTYEPTHVVIEAALAKPGLVVLSDAWFPGWEATVRTQDAGADQSTTRATIHRTNRVLRGVWLPAGKHTLEMRYRSATFIRGAAISGAAWAALVVLGLVVLTQRHRGSGGRREDK
jgi:hypothetical protein